MPLALSKGTIIVLFLAAIVISGVGLFYTLDQLKEPTAGFGANLDGWMTASAVEDEESSGIVSINILPASEAGESKCGEGTDCLEAGEV